MSRDVGICFNRAPVLLDLGLPSPYCHLTAGHAGAHDDGQGCYWSRDTLPERVLGSLYRWVQARRRKRTP